MVLVFVFHLGLKRCGWMGRGGGTSERAAKCGNVPKAVPFWDGAQPGFPAACSTAESRKSDRAESKPCRQVRVGTVSNVIYQRCM